MSYIAEQTVIGALLMDHHCISDIYNIIEPEMFTQDFYKRAYTEFARGYDNNYLVDAVVLEQKLRSDIYSTSFIMQEIKKCLERTITSVNVYPAAKVVLKDYKAFKLNSILKSVTISPDKIESQITDILSDLELLQGRRKTKAKSLPQIVIEHKDNYFKQRKAPNLNLGFEKIDDMLGGLEGGDLIIIGARPAVGKSALVTQITSYLASQGKRIGFYNLEMQDKQMYERFIVSESGIGLTRLRRAIKFLANEKERFEKANEALMSRENIVISTGGKKVGEIKSESKYMNYDVIIVDYLQLLKPDKSYGNRFVEVGSISKTLKDIAMDLNIPIIALSQLNRASEARDVKEPTMSELREAGDIEQDASVIILMWNLSQEDPKKKGCKVEKNRQGITGKIVLEFDGDHMRFKESKEDIKHAQEWATQKDDECPFQ